jgi:hypothetical protein
MKSAYADRDTVGTIALKARKENDRICVGDMAHEFMPQLVEDLNEAITSNPFEDRPFYIIIHEKKDAQLTNVILRRVIKQEFRPYPEPSTTVFWTDPKSHETTFCWALPHQSTFPQYLNNASKYHKDQIKDIVAYNTMRMDHFGFYKHGVTEKGVPIYYPLPGFKDRPLHKKKNGTQ